MRLLGIVVKLIKTFKNFSKSKKLKNIICKILTYTNIKATQKLMFLTFYTRQTFNYLEQAFIKALILQHFDLKYYIQIEINVSNYTIRRILGQFNLNQLNFNQIIPDESKFSKFKNLIKILTKSDFNQ